MDSLGYPTWALPPSAFQRGALRRWGQCWAAVPRELWRLSGGLIDWIAPRGDK